MDALQGGMPMPTKQLPSLLLKQLLEIKAALVFDLQLSGLHGTHLHLKMSHVMRECAFGANWRNVR